MGWCEMAGSCGRVACVRVEWVGADPATPTTRVPETRRACAACAKRYRRRRAYGPGVEPVKNSKLWHHEGRIMALASDSPGVELGTLAHVLGLSTTRISEIVRGMRRRGVVHPFGTMVVRDPDWPIATEFERRVMAALMCNPTTGAGLMEATGLTHNQVRRVLMKLREVGVISGARGVVLA